MHNFSSLLNQLNAQFLEFIVLEKLFECIEPPRFTNFRVYWTRKFL